jgi:DNA-binding MarR family transcriptional regulator
MDRLVADGLISRETPPENRRVVYGRVTDAGLVVLARARKVFEASLEQSFARHLSSEEIQQLRQILRRLLEANGAWEEHRCLPAFDGPEGLTAQATGLVSSTGQAQ